MHASFLVLLDLIMSVCVCVFCFAFCNLQLLVVVCPLMYRKATTLFPFLQELPLPYNLICFTRQEKIQILKSGVGGRLLSNPSEFKQEKQTVA